MTGIANILDWTEAQEALDAQGIWIHAPGTGTIVGANSWPGYADTMRELELDALDLLMREAV